jgi:hypothetical protein
MDGMRADRGGGSPRARRGMERFLEDEINPENLRLLQRFIRSRKGLAPSSKAAYKSSVALFLRFVHLNYGSGNVLGIPLADMADMEDDYAASLALGSNAREATIKNRLAALSLFFGYYTEKGKYCGDPAALRGGIAASRTYLTMEQISAIREGLGKLGNVQLELFFELEAFTLARERALANMLDEQADLDSMSITGVKDILGRRSDYIINRKCRDLIVEWRKEREKLGIESKFLLCCRSGASARDCIHGWWIAKIGELAGEPKLKVVDIRQSSACLRRAMGMRPLSVARIMNPGSPLIPDGFRLSEEFEILRQEALRHQI